MVLILDHDIRLIERRGPIQSPTIPGVRSRCGGGAPWATTCGVGTWHRAPGDVTIPSGDVTGATPDKIGALEVIATIVGGTVVHCSHTDVAERTEATRIEPSLSP